MVQIKNWFVSVELEYTDKFWHSDHNAIAELDQNDTMHWNRHMDVTSMHHGGEMLSNQFIPSLAKSERRTFVLLFNNPSVCRNTRVRITFVSPPWVIGYSRLIETCLWCSSQVDSVKIEDQILQQVQNQHSCRNNIHGVGDRIKMMQCKKMWEGKDYHDVCYLFLFDATLLQSHNNEHIQIQIQILRTHANASPMVNPGNESWS
jgi:hypothetical protein